MTNLDTLQYQWTISFTLQERKKENACHFFLKLRNINEKLKITDQMAMSRLNIKILGMQEQTKFQLKY